MAIGAGLVSIDQESVSDRIRLGLHYLDENPDPALGWMPYSGGQITGPTSYYAHGEWDCGDCAWRMVEAYLLARHALGDPKPGEAEQKLRAFVLSTIREDGLCWRPRLPWSEPEAFMFDHGRALIALATWMRLEPSEDVASVAWAMAHGLDRIAIREAGGSIYPAENWTERGWGAKIYAHPPTGLFIEGLVDLASTTGDERFLEMARRNTVSVMRREPVMFSEDGSIVARGGGPHEFWFTHVHSRLAILLGLAKYAVSGGDPQLLGWCRRCFAYVRDRLSSTFGWVPESLEPGSDPSTKWVSFRRRDEGCCISDMMQIAAFLARHGHPEESELIGRYGCNQLFAHQHVDFDRIRHLMGGGCEEETAQRSGRRMPDRCRGGSFLGCYPGEAALDMRTFGFEGPFVDVAGCCSSAVIKALCLLQQEALAAEPDSLEVRLWVTIETADAAVACGEPGAGRLQITPRRPFERIAVRVPPYLDPSSISLPTGATVRGRTILIPSRKAGEAVVLTYPLADRTARETIDGDSYEVRWRGVRVLGIAPTGSADPYYWRQSHRTKPAGEP